jgi:BioD-like phosphotransacetylase family protein
MATLYVASTETFVGKSAVCVGLLHHLQQDGLRIGYMKPVSVSVAYKPGAVLDEDAAFIRDMFGLPDSLDQIAPVLVTPSTVEAIMRNQQKPFARRLQTAYMAVSRDRDVVVVEGTNTWSEGALVDLSADQVTDMLAAPALLVVRYNNTIAIDSVLAVRRYMGDRLLGVLLNQVEEPQLDFVQSRVVPYLESQNIPVFGLLPQDQSLSGVTVDELYDHLGGQWLGNRNLGENLVASLMVGAMGPESGLSFFRRRANKAVITGGDRTDLQLAALETSTSVLVLTGNIRPSPQVIDRAEERGVPIIIVPDDTLSTVERAEMIFGHIRFHQKSKLDSIINLMEERLDWDRLYNALGLVEG